MLLVLVLCVLAHANEEYETLSDWTPRPDFTEGYAKEEWTWAPKSVFSEGVLYLLANTPSQGFLWSKKKVESPGWEAIITISLGDAIGAAFWATTGIPPKGLFVGISGTWQGVGIFVHNDQVSDSMLTIQAIVNDGTGSYPSFSHTIRQSGLKVLGQCLSTKKDTMSFRLRYVKETFTVETATLYNGKESWELCTRNTEAKIPYPTIFLGATTSATNNIERIPYISKFQIRSVFDTPVSIQELSTMLETPDDLIKQNGFAWQKVASKVVGHEKNTNLSVEYVESLFQESGRRMEKFEREFNPLVKTVERLLKLAQSKSTEIDIDTKAMATLEQQVRSLELSIGSVEATLTNVFAGIQAAKSLEVPNARARKHTIFDMVDWWFGLLVVQTVLIFLFVCYKSRRNSSRSVFTSSSFPR